MSIAASVPTFTTGAKSKKTALAAILSSIKVDGSYISVHNANMDTLRCSAAKAGLYLVEKRAGVLGVWQGDTLFGTWHKARNQVKIWEEGCRPYGN